MKGVPKYLNTKEDYEYVRKNFSKEIFLPFFQALLNDQKAWFYVKELHEGEIGLSDATHKIEIQNGLQEKSIRYQYELRDNPNNLMHILGYTKSEVLSIINE